MFMPDSVNGYSFRELIHHMSNSSKKTGRRRYRNNLKKVGNRRNKKEKGEDKANGEGRQQHCYNDLPVFPSLHFARPHPSYTGRQDLRLMKKNRAIKSALGVMETVQGSGTVIAPWPIQ